MRVQCEKCRAEYNIDESRVPPDGLQIKCPKCLTVFVVRPPGAAPAAGGALFDLGAEGNDASLELDLPEEPAPAPPPAAKVGSSTLPPVGASSLPPIEGPAYAPQPKAGAEGQLFDFLEQNLGGAAAESEKAGPTLYRIRRKSGKVFGPFDLDTVKKMLVENQLMGNEEASSDGINFKPLGSFEEFAETIRSLMEEPAAVVSLPAAASSAATKTETVDVVAPQGVEFAEPPPQVGEKKGGGGAGVVIGLAVVLVVLIVGVALGFTRYGFFGIRLFTSDRGTEGGATVGTGTGAAAGAGDLEIARLYAEDTYAATEELIRDFQGKRSRKEDHTQDRFLAALALASALRNYGANEVYLQLGRQLVADLKDDQPNSPQAIKAEAAMSILPDPGRAYSLLKPLLEKDTRDKEALFLAGWALAYQKNWSEAARMFDAAIVLDPDFAKAYHALGDLQALQGDFENAALFYQKAAEKNPYHLQSVIEQARIVIEVNQEYEQGQALLDTVFGKQFDRLAPSEKAKAHALQARVHARFHRHEKVIEGLQAAIKLMPNKVEYQAELGSYYLDLGEFAKANQFFEEALQKDPKNIDTLLGKGRAMWKNGDIVKAKELLENTAKAAPADPRPLYVLGGIAEDLDKPDEAMALYQKAIELSPKFLSARVALSGLLKKRGQVADALGVLAEAVKINPRSAVVHDGLGMVYLAQKNLRLALKEFRTAIELDPDLASAHFNLANALRDSGELDEALAAYSRVAAIAPRYPGLALEQGYAYYLKKQYGEALKLFEDAILLHPKDDQLYLRAGLAAAALGDVNSAVNYLQTATGINRRNSQAVYHLGLLLQENKKEYEQAQELFKQVVEMDPNNADAHYQLGLCYLRQELIQDAVEELRHTIRLNPKHLQAQLALGNIFLERLQYEEAVQHLREAVRLEPEMSEVQLRLADAYLKQGSARQALKTLKTLQAKHPRAPRLDYLLGRAYQELENVGEAIKYYQKAIKENPSDPLSHFYLGYAYKSKGKNKLAISEFRTYLKLRPDAPDADEIREEIDFLLNE